MTVRVLLSTYNGEAFLREQLESLRAQSLAGVEVLVRDDGSTDGTPGILEEYRRRGVLSWRVGEHLGFARSFWELLRKAGDADHYAFCDQDDVWDPNKLEVAVAALEGIDGPALYCGDVRVVDARLGLISVSLRRNVPAGFPHALVWNPAPGCTYVLNRAARELLLSYDADELGIDYHDWLAFQVVSCLGTVVYDEAPHMGYRQHGGNANGAMLGLGRGVVRRVAAFWCGDKRNSRERAARRLERAYGDAMGPHQRELTADMAHYREEPARRWRLLACHGLRVSGANRLLLRLLVMLGRL